MTGKEFDKKETELCTRWMNSYSKEMQKQFCFDGLIYYRDPNCKDEYAEVEKWENAKRKVLFLMKDTNGNPGCDYREWPFYDSEKRVHKTFVTMIKCLWALNMVSSKHLPVFDKSREYYLHAALPYPMAIVNVKKISGGSSIINPSVWFYFDRDKHFLVEQIRDILRPNIIVCGGGSGTLRNIAIKYIYSDLEFVKYNGWCYYCKQEDVLIIDDYHPSYRYRDNEGLIEAVNEFYKMKEK